MVKDYQDIPVLLILFTRQDTTKQLIDVLRKVQPRTIYIAADGARTHKKGEDQRVSELREYVDQAIDWSCTIHKKYAQENLGCKYNPQDAITWFFEQVQMGVILEDDCIPSESFFPFAYDILNHYKNDYRIFGFTGTSMVSQASKSKASYYYSEYVQTWGWGTWADRWQMHLKNLENFEEHLDDPLAQSRIENKIANRQIIHRARISFRDQLDAWDYQWFYSAFANRGLFVVPSQNLVRNIGFGEDATHTKDMTNRVLKECEIDFPLVRPVNILPNLYWDDIFYKTKYGWLRKREKLTNKRFLAAYLRNKFRLK